jgi:acyl-coenzyme A thioesterase PaaI-like protein
MTMESGCVGSGVSDRMWRHTNFDLGTDCCIEGTDRLFAGVLFAYLDLVIGSPPSGPLNPTVDLQVRLLSPPRPGTIRFSARTLRLGRTLYVGEAEMRNGEDVEPFGIGLGTFMNQPVPFPDRATYPSASSGGAATLDPRYSHLTRARRIGYGTLEVDADINTPQGTVPGATIGQLAELATMDLVGSEIIVEELDVRFLHKVKVGPLRASAALIGRQGESMTTRVEIVDRGNDRLVSYALVVGNRPG